MLAVVVGCIATLASTAAGQVQVNRRIAIAPDASIKMWLPAGSLRLVAWDRDSLVVEGTVPAGERFFFGGSGKAAKFGIDDPAPGRVAQPAHLVVHVPRGGRVNVRSIAASVEATGVSGWFNTVAGDIRLGGVTEEVNAEAMDGSVHVDVTSPYVRARTASGSLTVAGRVEDLGAATVSGLLTVSATGILRGRFESMTGRIVLAPGLDEAATIDIDSHAAPIELRLATPLTGVLDLTSVTGTITNGLGKRLPTASRKGRGQELAFDTGTEGPRIVIRSFKGSIVLRPR